MKILFCPKQIRITTENKQNRSRSSFRVNLAHKEAAPTYIKQNFDLVCWC